MTTTTNNRRKQKTGRRTTVDPSAPGEAPAGATEAGQPRTDAQGQRADADTTSPTVTNIKLRSIDPALRPASQMRVQLDQEAIEAYAAHLDAMPPVTLFYDSSTKTHWVADGCHTIKAYLSRNKTSVPARVQQGSYQDAFHAAARANVTHGLRITNADKQHRIVEALRAWPEFSNSLLADICGVDEKTVRNTRKSTSDNPKLKGRKTLGRDGKYRRAPVQKTTERQPSPVTPDETHQGPDPGTPVSPGPIPSPSVPYETLVTDFARDALLATPDEPGTSPVTLDSRWDRAQQVHLALYREWPIAQREAYIRHCSGLYAALRDDSTAKLYWGGIAQGDLVPDSVGHWVPIDDRHGADQDTHRSEHRDTTVIGDDDRPYFVGSPGVGEGEVGFTERVVEESGEDEDEAPDGP